MLIVKKFGGSSVANKERIFNVARRCIEDYKAGHDVVVVLSAMGDTTDNLIENRRAGIRIAYGYGDAGTGCSGGILECISGYDAFYIQIWKCSF